MNVEEVCARDWVLTLEALLPFSIAHSPTCSLPLKAYSRQFLVDFRASGGSLYLRTTPRSVLLRKGYFK